jgi:enolase-phosphatase E1
MRFSGRGVLLDIEGTTSSISFVHDVMFPYVREHLAGFLDQRWPSRELDVVREQLARDDHAASWSDWLAAHTGSSASDRAAFEARILELMDGDVKATGLKTLQGLIWDNGFRSGQLQSHVYSDTIPAIEGWRAAGLDVRIYSSGSMAAQRLFFGHVAQLGDCLHLFSGHYDTSIGSKREAASYTRIATDWNLAVSEILFISDLAPELEAASTAGMQVAASIRPGNAPLPEPIPWPRIHSFAEVELG